MIPVTDYNISFSFLPVKSVSFFSSICLMKSPHFYRKQQHSLCCRRIILLKIDPVSYTHLDVYKRQPLPCKRRHLNTAATCPVRSAGSSWRTLPAAPTSSTNTTANRWRIRLNSPPGRKSQQSASTLSTTKMCIRDRCRGFR